MRNELSKANLSFNSRFHLNYNINMKGKAIFGHKLAQLVLKEISARVQTDQKQIGELPSGMECPRLAMVLVGDHPASLSYIRKKRLYANRASIRTRLFHIDTQKLDPKQAQQKICNTLTKLNKDPKYNGILLQLPLPKLVNKKEDEFLKMIAPAKDVDCLGEVNRKKFLQQGELAYMMPCVILAVQRMLQSRDIQIEGKRVLIIGRGKLVGDPLLSFLSTKSPHVAIMDKSNSIEQIKKQARGSDIIFTATGTQDILQESDFKKGCVVVDIGCSPDTTKPGKVRGDFSDHLKKKVCSFYSPVPRGVGPMVVASLMHNVHKAWRHYLSLIQKKNNK